MIVHCIGMSRQRGSESFNLAKYGCGFERDKKAHSLRLANNRKTVDNRAMTRIAGQVVILLILLMAQFRSAFALMPQPTSHFCFDHLGSPAESFNYSQNRITGLTFDTDGNLTDDGVNTYVYDALGQTASVTNSGGTVSYRYDALGKRISANDGSVDTVYAYLGEQLITEYAGVDYANSVFLEGQLLARVTDNGVDTTTVRYAHRNHLGSPVAFTDDSGTVVWPEQVGGTPYESHNYEPFGADFDDIGTPALSPQDVRYTGKLFDADTEKHYFNARYLNAVTDVASPELPPRFLSPDIVIGTPESPQSWNRYASCLNNPVNNYDLNGREVYYKGPHASRLEQIVSRLEEASPTIKKTLSYYSGPNNPDLTFNTDAVVLDTTGIPAEGTHEAHIALAMFLDSTGCNLTDKVNTALSKLNGVSIFVLESRHSNRKQGSGSNHS